MERETVIKELLKLMTVFDCLREDASNAVIFDRLVPLYGVLFSK